MLSTFPNWPDYQLLDSGNRRKLEKFGPYLISRPSPTSTWLPQLSQTEWLKVDASFKIINHQKNQGEWTKKTAIPESWPITWQNITVNCSLLPYGHIGIFPEQEPHWQWLYQTIKKIDPTNQPQILNLFGYTGVASLACAAAGAKVTHVDSSFPAIGKARANQELSNLTDKPIRWIKEDVLKYVSRELNRGVKYDGIIMDPPKFGHGPHGEIWTLSKSFPQLLEICQLLLTDQPLFILINAYAFEDEKQLRSSLEPFFKQIKEQGQWQFDQLRIDEQTKRKFLNMGHFAKWERN
jgi:23S rRNA (cytosine1962-C5)-methyltransferase